MLTLPEPDSLHLKLGWAFQKERIVFPTIHFSGAKLLLVSGRVSSKKTHQTSGFSQHFFRTNPSRWWVGWLVGWLVGWNVGIEDPPKNPEPTQQKPEERRRWTYRDEGPEEVES